MENYHFVAGKIHYFYGHFKQIQVLVDKCLNHHSFPPCHQPQVKRATALAGKGGVAA
jgi:hypothetical protein